MLPWGRVHTKETYEELALRIMANMEKFGLQPTLEEIRASIRFCRECRTPERARMGIINHLHFQRERGKSEEWIAAHTPTVEEWLALDDDGRREERRARRQHFLRLAEESGDFNTYRKLRDDFRARGGHFLPWDPPDSI